MRIILPFLVASFLILSGTAGAQCTVSISATDTLLCSVDTVTLFANANGPDNQLQASNASGNNHRGNMFDIVATNSVTILSFDVSPMGNTTIEIYYKAGTWDGFANTPAAWTLIGSAPVTYTGGFVPVAVPVNVTIPAGQTYAFYVTSNTSAVSLNYSNGTAVGNIFSSDANIAFIEGGGMEYPFTQGTGAVYQPRVWNGNIHYALADIPGTTYTWSTAETTESIEPVVAASTQYAVEVTIPGCATMYDTLDISVSIPVVDAGSDQFVCEGTSVTLFGSGTESYTWDNGVTDSVDFVPAATMDYSVTGVDSVGCTDTDTVTVTVFELPVVFAGVDMSACDGDSVVLSGQGADTYVWDNGVTDNIAFVPAGSAAYAVTGTDTNGCIGTDTIVVEIDPLPVVSAGQDVSICGGVEYTLYGSGADTYQWDNGVTDGQSFVPAAGTYTVTGTDTNGCTGSDEMVFTITSITAPIALNITTLSTALMPNGTIQWINCSDMSPIADETTALYTPTLTGSYAAILTTNEGCADTSDCLLVDFTGIAEAAAAELSVYPVPTNGTITVLSTGAPIERVELIDLLGNVIETKEPMALQTELDLSAYPANQFFVRVLRGGSAAFVRVSKQ